MRPLLEFRAGIGLLVALHRDGLLMSGALACALVLAARMVAP